MPHVTPVAEPHIGTSRFPRPFPSSDERNEALLIGDPRTLKVSELKAKSLDMNISKLLPVCGRNQTADVKKTKVDLFDFFLIM